MSQYLDSDLLIGSDQMFNIYTYLSPLPSVLGIIFTFSSELEMDLLEGLDLEEQPMTNILSFFSCKKFSRSH